MDPSKWLVIELTEQGEGASYPELTVALKSVFDQDVDFFIPVYYEQLGSYTSTNVLFEGYVFVKESDKVQDCIKGVRDSRFFAGFVKNNGKMQRICSKQIGVLRRKLRSSLKKRYRAGVRVKVNEGIFQNLEGDIQEMQADGKIANVRIKCMSREIIAPIPVTCMEAVR